MEAAGEALGGAELRLGGEEWFTFKLRPDRLDRQSITLYFSCVVKVNSIMIMIHFPINKYIESNWASFCRFIFDF